MAIPNWLNFSQSSGSGDTIITITAETSEEITARISNLVVSGHTKHLNLQVKQKGNHYSSEYLTFNILSGGTIYWKRSGSSGAETRYIDYRKNGGEWVTIGSTSAGTPIYVDSGDIIEFRGENTGYTRTDTYGNSYVCGQFNTRRTSSVTPPTYNVYGNVFSMFYGDNFEDYDYMPGTSRQLQTFFEYCDGLVNAQNLVLPATTLDDACYYEMFIMCRDLVVAPKILPALELQVACYAGMFQSCYSLTTPPQLPATTLNSQCYDGMFTSCSGLTSAPVLPATTLAEGCYSYMFNRCTSLSAVTCLATDISASNCTLNWLNNVSSAGTFTKAASMSDWTTGVNGIPSGWTVVNA